MVLINALIRVRLVRCAAASGDECFTTGSWYLHVLYTRYPVGDRDTPLEHHDSPPGHPDKRSPSMDTMSGRPLTSKICQHACSLLKSTHTAKPWRTCPSHYLPVVV